MVNFSLVTTARIQLGYFVRFFKLIHGNAGNQLTDMGAGDSLGGKSKKGHLLSE